MDDRTYNALKRLENANFYAFQSLDNYTRQEYYDEKYSRQGMHKVKRNNYDDPCHQFDEEWEEWRY